MRYEENFLDEVDRPLNSTSKYPMPIAFIFDYQRKLNMVIKFTSDTCQHEIRSLFRSSSFFLHFFYDRFILYQGNKFQIFHRNKIKTPKISLLISPHSIIRCQDVRIRERLFKKQSLCIAYNKNYHYSIVLNTTCTFWLPVYWLFLSYTCMLFVCRPELLALFPKWKNKILFSLGERREEFRMICLPTGLRFDIFLFCPGIILCRWTVVPV